MENLGKALFGIFFTMVIAACAVFLTTMTAARARVDLTNEKLYSLTDGTRSILKELNIKITARLYYTKESARKAPEDVKYFNVFHDFVYNLLQEYQALSGGKIGFIAVDPRPDTEEEDEVEKYDLQKIPLGDDFFCFGLVLTNELGAEKVMSFLDPSQQPHIEYEITKLIYSLYTPKKKIGILSTQPVAGMDEEVQRQFWMMGRQPPPPWAIHSAISDLYTVEAVPLTAKSISSDLEALIVIHPKGLEEATLYAIDQYFMAGGRLMILEDPWYLQDTPERNPRMPQQEEWGSEINSVTSYYGVELVRGAFAADRNLASNSAVPAVLAFTQDEMPVDSPISSQLSDLFLVTAGALALNDRAQDKTVLPILQTTAEGNQLHVTPQEFNMRLESEDQERMWEGFEPGAEPQVLGYELTGTFSSAFPNGRPEAAEEEGDGHNEDGDDGGEAVAEHLPQSKHSTTLIVFSDVDFISDRYAFGSVMPGLYRPTNQNSALFVNALEYLSGADDLRQVRSRGRKLRDFKVVREMEKRVDRQTKEKIQRLNKELEEINQKLGEISQEGQLTEAKVLEARREWEQKRSDKRSEIREINREKRQEIEKLGAWCKWLNILCVPGLVLLCGLWVTFYRANLRKEYVGGRS